MRMRAIMALGAILAGLGGCAGTRTVYRDDFQSGISNYVVEMEKAGTVTASDGVMEIQSEGGCTVWLKQELMAPVEIDYEVTPIKADGKWDRVSDVNCFWMATDSRAANGDFFGVKRTGKFADYDQLYTYYVGQGGNTNKTTRFRRYIGKKDDRPLLPVDDLKGADVPLQPNAPLKIRLIAAHGRVEYWCNGRMLFAHDDPQPYTHGYFGFRTTWSHLQVRNLRVTAVK